MNLFKFAQDLSSYNSEARKKAEIIRKKLNKEIAFKPHLFGSLRTGLNLPGTSDFDYIIPTSNYSDFKSAVYNLQHHKDFKPSSTTKDYEDIQVFKGEIDGTKVDAVVALGDKGSNIVKRITTLSRKLTPEQRERLIKLKSAKKNSIFSSSYHTFKKLLDEELGLQNVPRQRLKSPEEYEPDRKRLLNEIKRKDIYGHRTTNIEPIISGGLLSAVQAARKGKLGSYEKPGSRERLQGDKMPDKFRSEIFMTKGLLPKESYGNYGVLFRKRDAEESKYLNDVPDEFVARNVKSKLIFSVPDPEFDEWTKKFPNASFVRESEIPKEKRLPDRDWTQIVKRFFKGPKFVQETEKV